MGSGEFTIHFFAHAGEKWVYLNEKILRWQAAERGVPHPLVAHGADAALHLLGIGDAAERCGNHIAMFERRNEFWAFPGIMAKPMQELGETPLRGIDAATPLDRRELLAMRGCGDFRRFRLGAMIAP